MLADFYEVGTFGITGRVREDDENESLYSGSLTLTLNTFTTTPEGEIEQETLLFILDAHTSRALRFEFDQRVEGDPDWNYGSLESQERAENELAAKNADVGNATG